MLTTILNRPYVFAFLIAFLVLGRLYWGWRKTFLWLVIGYVVAWASEYSSIHNGFPYGLYYYRYENMPGETMVFGVPFWDSLSYPFMIFAGYTTARFILGLSFPHKQESQEIPANDRGDDRRFADLRTKALRHLGPASLGAFLTMLLDIIIDPLTVRGDKWFLGNIYYYPGGGEYFGVPLTNFAGWFLVPLVVILVFQLCVIASPPKADEAIPGAQLSAGDPSGPSSTLRTFLNPLFYLSIAIFNVAITVYINEPLIVAIDSLILIPIVALITWRVKKINN